MWWSPSWGASDELVCRVAGSAVDDPAQLAGGEVGRGDDAAGQFGGELVEDLLVAAPMGLQVRVPAPDVVLDRLAVKGDDVVDDARRDAGRQAGRGDDAFHKIRVGHSSMMRDRPAKSKHLPGIGQICWVTGCAGPSSGQNTPYAGRLRRRVLATRHGDWAAEANCRWTHLLFWPWRPRHPDRPAIGAPSAAGPRSSGSAAAVSASPGGPSVRWAAPPRRARPRRPRWPVPRCRSGRSTPRAPWPARPASRSSTGWSAAGSCPVPSS